LKTAQRNGIEDARFVRFQNDDGTHVYYATFTAFDGQLGIPQLLETSDFLLFRCQRGEDARPSDWNQQQASQPSALLRFHLECSQVGIAQNRRIAPRTQAATGCQGRFGKMSGFQKCEHVETHRRGRLVARTPLCPTVHWSRGQSASDKAKLK
jgi:hypothetical protein